MRRSLPCRKLLLTALMAAAAIGCSERGGQEDQVAVSRAAMNNGTLVADNTIRAVRFMDANGAEGSGVILDAFASYGTVLTAGHNVIKDDARRVGPDEVTVYLEDNFSVVDEVGALHAVPHPTFMFSKSEREEVSGENTPDVTILLKGIDLAVLITEPFETQVGFHNDLYRGDPALIVDFPMDLYGYGPLAFGDNSSFNPLNMFTQTPYTTDAVFMPGPPGVVTPTMGLVFGFRYATGPEGEQFIVSGDSGGPIAWQNATGQDVLVGLGIRGPIVPVKPLVSVGMSFFGFEDWIDAVVSSGGRIGEADYDERLRTDQLIVIPGPSQWIIHTEFGCGGPLATGGGRSRHVMAPPAGGAGLAEFTPVVSGRFDATVGRDAVGLLDNGTTSLAVEILNPAGDAPAPKVLSDESYSSVATRALNSDRYDDVEAVRESGGSHFYFGSASGLSGPFESGNFDTCLSGGRGGTACGRARTVGGTCSCTLDCVGSQTMPCCPDFVSVCASTIEEEFLQKVSILLGGLQVPVSTPTPKQYPIAEVVTSMATTVGTFLDRNWVLTTALDDAITAADVTLHQEGTLDPISVAGVFRHADAPLSLIRVASTATVDVPQGYHVTLYEGAGQELALEIVLNAFGTSDSGALRVASLPQAAAFVHNVNADEGEFSLSMLEPSGLLEEPVTFTPGAPVFSESGQLVSLASATETDIVTLSDGLGGTFDVELAVNDQVPLIVPTQVPTDMRPGANYFIEQTLRRDELRDFARDAQQDLWVFAKPTPLSYAGILHVPFDSPGVADSPEGLGGPVPTEPGNWRLVGRGKIGRKHMGILWQDPDTGALMCWSLSDPMTIESQIALYLTPPWQVQALADVDGDGIDDWILTDSLDDRCYFWLMQDIDSFGDPGTLTSDPTQLIRYGQWFYGMPLADDPATEYEERVFELVGAEHFEVPLRDIMPATGPEQRSADLVWQEVGGSATVISPMAVTYQRCGDFGDDLIAPTCSSPDDLVLAYEQTRIARTLSRPSYWRYSGAADYDNDGRLDLLWHARGEDAPAEESGTVELWMARADGEYDTLTVTRDGLPLWVDPTAYEVAVR